MKIKVGTVKKLLPYNGFYPMTRTVQLGNLLSSSLSKTLRANKVRQQVTTHRVFRQSVKLLCLRAFFTTQSKQGYGVSYPVYKTSPTTIVDAVGVDKNVYEGFHIETKPDYQIPLTRRIGPKGQYSGKRRYYFHTILDIDYSCRTCI